MGSQNTTDDSRAFATEPTVSMPRDDSPSGDESTSGAGSKERVWPTDPTDLPGKGAVIAACRPELPSDQGYHWCDTLQLAVQASGAPLDQSWPQLWDYLIEVAKEAVTSSGHICGESLPSLIECS